MGAHILEQLFNPRGVAVFGASEREGAVGTMVLANLIKAGFKGPIVPVNPKHKEVQGLPCQPDLSRVEPNIDLAIIATPRPDGSGYPAPMWRGWPQGGSDPFRGLWRGRGGRTASACSASAWRSPSATACA